MASTTFNDIRKLPATAKIRLVGLYASALGVVFAAGWAIGGLVWLQFQPTIVGHHAVAQTREPAAVASPAFTFQYEVKNLSFHLMDRAESRVAYTQFTLVLDLPDAEAKHVMQMNHARIFDTVFEVASTYFIEDFQKPSGFESFKGSLLAHFRADYKEHPPKQVVIKDWLLN